MTKPRFAGGLLALACLLPLHHAHAGPNEYIPDARVVEGEREFELTAGAARLRDGGSATAHTLSFGLGVNSWWFTEVQAKWHRPAGERAGFDAWEWENRFQLTETGRYLVDLAILFEIERPKDRAEGYELTYGPLLQADIGDWQVKLNLLWQKQLRVEAPSATELHYQWELRRRFAAGLDYGVQGLGNVGQWDRWAGRGEQEHRLGPALFGKLKLEGRQYIKYNAGLLFGLGDATPRTTLRVQAEYEF